MKNWLAIFAKSFLLLMLAVPISCTKPVTPDIPDPTMDKDTIVEPIHIADPTIFYDGKLYFLYGTLELRGAYGFSTYYSKDLKSWKDFGPNRYVLNPENAYGTKGFWAPQVVDLSDQYGILYAANERIAIAYSSSPFGPFTNNQKSISGFEKQIDPFLFIDGEKKYLYYVKLEQGNKLYVNTLNDALKIENTKAAKLCIEADQPWENSQNSDWPVAEGPTVIKRGDRYYLFYSANDFRNIDYAVGYATSDNPLGPWKKSDENPILDRNKIPAVGIGHGDIFQDEFGDLHYVFHTHYSEGQVLPRKTAIVSISFEMDENNEERPVIDYESFRYLNQIKQ